MNLRVSGRPNILIVDDTPTNIEILLGMLEDEYELSFSHSGYEALALLEKDEKPDLILLDAMMPEMDGYAVLQTLKLSPDTKDIPVIFVTAKVDSKSEEMALRNGAVDFIHKPVNKNVVRARVRLHLDLKWHASALTHANRELAQHRNQLEKLVESRTSELVAARDAAEAANRAKSAFLSNMSHELRTPINGIMGMADLSLRTATDPKQKLYLQQAVIASQHLRAVINDIIEFSSLEGPETLLEPSIFRLGSILECLPQLFGPRLTEKNLAFCIQIPDTLAGRMVQGDALRLKQVLARLVDNAIKFTPDGSIVVKALQVAEYENNLLVRFEVSDTGIGIPLEAQASLFSPFHTPDTSTTRQHDGTGLGLAISKKLTVAMGGSIGVDSSPDTGSTFWFTILLSK